jgi:hypothetical protein
MNAFIAAMRARVSTGLLTNPRARYAVRRADASVIEVRAMDWRTAIGIGLNDIELLQYAPGSIHYRVRYWRWASYVIGLGAALGLTGAALLLGLDVRGYIERHPQSMIPGTSAEGHMTVAWLLILFWGFVWPWLLITMHKGPLRRVITSLITDVDAAALSTHSS